MGPLSWLTIVFAFGMVPVIDQLGTISEDNWKSEQVADKLKDRFFDWLLYLNLPLVYLAIAGTIYVLSTQAVSTYEIAGVIVSLGSLLSAMGINVGHELGHRNNKIEQGLSKLLYLPSHYIHFFIEHNKGHHKNVATPLDPATSCKGQSLYAFWIQSVVGGYCNAWNIENNRLRQSGQSLFTWHNQMVRFTVYQLSYWVIILIASSPMITLLLMIAGVLSFLQLETINYVEHYGLQRKMLPSGRYERVQSHHSWNANYPFGRILLYELTRHSDHHFIASKKYQILDHHADAPELPYGYPASMIASMIPPLWYAIMDDRVPA
jgi:alkane 1-monooxygenase